MIVGEIKLDTGIKGIPGICGVAIRKAWGSLGRCVWWEIFPSLVAWSG
jgi:hypothetical protein